MISLLDVAERAQKGPKMDDMTWNMSLFHKMNELARRYDICVPSDCSYFNEDEAILDRVFQAGIDFLVERGVYCVTTSRVIQFTRDEVLQAIRESIPAVPVGCGRDVRVMRQRRIEEHDELNQVPALHAPYSEELAPLAVKNYAQIATADYLEGFNFKVTDGREIFGLPMEAYAARREVAWLREGIRKAGRPGMGIAFYPITTRAAVLVAPMDPDYGLRRTDGVLLTVLPELKVEQDMLTAAIVYNDYGCFVIGAAGGTAGGFVGGLEGAMIEGVARGITGWMCYHDVINGGGASKVGPKMATRLGVDRQSSWASSVVCQVLNTRFHTILYSGGYTLSGPGTETALVERAVFSVRIPINGCNVSYPRHSRAQVNAAQTPLEAEFAWEIAQAVMRMKMTRAQCDAFYDKLAAWATGREAEPAQDVRDCYDWVHHRPSPAYYEKYLRVKDQLASMGLQFAG
ncbi:MAG: monomethylamine:corrinoid methyltransferase [Chloroflexi bacterium]|nr:monomethylamine:corrinoid methyltransferase [Chloroflexota bacterium]MCL5025111.1 monomethylamine:corrinoid methyltransferase [Chloroflexota bacterium]